MGNCLVLEEKVIRVMKNDGKILEYKHPIKVQQVLSQFSHHAISQNLPTVKNMHPSSETTTTTTKKKKKAVRFSDEVLQEGAPVPPSGVVRIKIVMSKKELRRMLSEGEIRVDDMIRKVQKDEVISKGWSPALDCIPEINTLV